jgi:hypothetical protein
MPKPYSEICVGALSGTLKSVIRGVRRPLISGSRFPRRQSDDGLSARRQPRVQTAWRAQIRHARSASGASFASGEEKEDITMPELAEDLATACGARADPASLSRCLIRNGYRFKKNASGQRMRSPRHSPGARGMEG